MFKRQIIVFIFFIFIPAVGLAILFAPLRSVGMALHLVIALTIVFLITRLLTWPFYYFSDMLPRWLNSIFFLLTGAAFIVIWSAMLYQRYLLWGDGGDALSFILNNMFLGHRVMINDLIQYFSGYDMGLSFFTIGNDVIMDVYVYGVFIFASASTGFILSRAELKANENFETDAINYTTNDYVKSEIKDRVKINYYKETHRTLEFRREWTPSQIYMFIMWLFLLLMFYFPLFTVALMMIYAIVRMVSPLIIKVVLATLLTGAFLFFFFSPSAVLEGYKKGFEFRQIFYGDGKLIYRVNRTDALAAINSVDKNKQKAGSNYTIEIREIATPLYILEPTSIIEKVNVNGSPVTKFTVNDAAIAPVGTYYLTGPGGKSRIIYINGEAKDVFADGTEKYKLTLEALNNFNFNAATNTKYYLQSKENSDVEAKTRNNLMYIVYYYSKRDFRDGKVQLSPNLIIKDGNVVGAEMEVNNRAYRFYINYGNTSIDAKEFEDLLKK